MATHFGPNTKALCTLTFLTLENASHTSAPPESRYYPNGENLTEVITDLFKKLSFKGEVASFKIVSFQEVGDVISTGKGKYMSTFNIILRPKGLTASKSGSELLGRITATLK